MHDVETGGDSPAARFGAGLRRIRVPAGLSVRLLARELDLAHSSERDIRACRYSLVRPMNARLATLLLAERSAATTSSPTSSRARRNAWC